MAESNRLAGERSPYLLQHKDNPVDWFPWGEEVFAAARGRDCPVFLSVGYSTCHWCHVMERESFEDEGIAGLLNGSFVSVKVDREERPDIDRFYMAYVMATTGSGGWPMSVFLTPDAKPFFGGTYFPPDDRPGRPGFPRILRELARLWRDDRDRLLTHAAEVTAAILDSQAEPDPSAGGGELDAHRLAAGLVRQLARRFDPAHGGFGGAPKFPMPPLLDFLLRWSLAPGADTGDRESARDMAARTLRGIVAGGIHDHVGGGFHRYSVDRRWHVPHFEKMLYDQAQLACTLTDAARITGDGRLADAAIRACEYVLRDLRHPEGGLLAAEDADSLPTPEDTRKSEGAYYVWTHDEVRAALGSDADRFAEMFAVRPGGNVGADSDPHGELAGRNVLMRVGGTDGDDAFARSCLERLGAARNRRPRPHCDDKVLTAWNGMMIAALAKVGATQRRPDFIEAAQRAARFLRCHLGNAGAGDPGGLHRAWRGGHGGVTAFPDDYAQVINGLIHLTMADGDPEWLAWALELDRAMTTRFARDGGGLAGSDGGDPLLPAALSDDHDGVEPSAASQSLRNLALLAALTTRDGLRGRAERLAAVHRRALEDSPTSLPAMLGGLLDLRADPSEVILADGGGDATALLATAWRSARPGTVIIHARADAAESVFGDRAALLREIAGRATRPEARVCANRQCGLPVHTPEALGQAMNAA